MQQYGTLLAPLLLIFCGMKVGHTNYKGELNAKAECHKVRKRIPINKLNDVDVLGAFW